MNPRLFLCLTLLAMPAVAQQPEPGERPRPGGGPAEQARAGRPGPWDRDVIVYRAPRDGAVERVAAFERAGVPTIARMADGRLIAAHQHFPADFGAGFDKVAVHFSSDEGRTWSTAQVIQLTGLPEGMRFPFDPTLVPLPDGHVRLYFTSTRGRGPEQAPPAIHSAISRDGVNYEFEPGMRFGVEGQRVIDCAVALHRGVFHLFAPHAGAADEPPGGSGPRQGRGYHATSPDGLNFTRAADVEIEGRRSWLGNAQSDGRAITFYGTGPGLWTATSEDGLVWKLGPDLGIRGGDPGAVATKDGGVIVVITGESRPGTPREPRR